MLSKEIRPKLAVYHGQQFDSLSNRCSHTGHRVYTYPFEYLTYGVGSAANLITRPTGAKEYKIVDHLGSTRVVLDTAGSVINRTDYEPFGTPIAVTGVDSRKKYIDKELDGESGTANHGVRQYDMVVGAFSSIDPLWEQYRAYSPYQYSANNPLRLVDHNGMQVDVGDVEFKDGLNNTQYTKEMVNDLQNKTGLALRVEKEFLLYDKTKTNTNVGSPLARQLLMNAIDAKDEIDVLAVNDQKSSANLGGFEARLNMAQIQFGINNTHGANNTTMGFAMSFLHEILHTAVGPSGGISDEGSDIGQVETLLNGVRKELGPEYGQRLRYNGRAFLNSGNAYIPFSFDAQMSLKQDIEPTSGMFVMTRKANKEK